jgi:putative transposase
VTVEGNKVPDEQIQEWLLELVGGSGSRLWLWEVDRVVKAVLSTADQPQEGVSPLQRVGNLVPTRQKRVQRPRKIAKNRVITTPNQLWWKGE